MRTMGIDIGIHGGVALVDSDSDAACVADMPTIEREIGGKLKRRVASHELAALLEDFSRDGTIAFVERAQASPQMGVSSAFGFGEAFGIVVGVLAQLGVKTRFVSAVKWKRDFGLIVKGNAEIGTDGHKTVKAPSLDLARRLYPQLHASLNLAKHDGRAEALLLAHWGCELLEEEAGPLFGREKQDARARATTEVEF